VRVRAQQALGNAAKKAAADPEVQGAFANAAKAAAADAANQGWTKAKEGFSEVRQYVENDPDQVRIVALVVALALFISSILAVINIFGALFNPQQYLLALYNACFALVIIAMEGKPEWMKKFGNVQKKTFWCGSISWLAVGQSAFLLLRWVDKSIDVTR